MAENICGEEIAYEMTTDSLSEDEERLYREAISDFEDNLAIIAEIQNERTADGGIKRPPTSEDVNTILEVGVKLDRSLAILRELDKGEADCSLGFDRSEDNL